MATSKAHQAKEWWEEISSSGQERRIVYPPLPRPSSRQVRRNRGSERPPLRVEDTPFNVYPGKSVQLTRHASLRMAQRNLSAREINYVLLHGQTVNQARATITYLRWKDVPPAERDDPRNQKLVGTTIIMPRRGRQKVITVYRDRQAGPKKH